jgi:hypothetical protein
MGNSSNSYATSRPLEGSVVDRNEQQDNFNKQFKYRKDRDEQEKKDKNAKRPSLFRKAVAPITDILVTMKRLLTL